MYEISNIPYQGTVKDKAVVHANKQDAKVWHIVAIALAALVALGIGGFGGMGLLQSYHIISLPPGLASLISTVGNTPHFWSLWVMTGGGFLTGTSLIVLGFCKIHKTEKPIKITDTNNKKTDSNNTEIDDINNEIKEINKKINTNINTNTNTNTNIKFGNNFYELGITTTKMYEQMIWGTFLPLPNIKPERGWENTPTYYTILRTDEGTILCTGWMTYQEQQNQIKLLELTYRRGIIPPILEDT